jgi:hypothetical protein
MTDYCIGISYATGCMVNENGKKFLVVRNIDPWYPFIMQSETTNTAYKTINNKKDAPQWVLKARKINTLPSLSDVVNPKDFCRAYIEIHGVVDLSCAKDRRGNHFKKPRLRIYGTEEILSYLLFHLPANKKKIQYIQNSISGGYSGKTCAIYYQSTKEILQILQWINGTPQNVTVWNQWNEIINVRDIDGSEV